MTRGRSVPPLSGAAPAPHVIYSDSPAAMLLQQAGTLAVFDFGGAGLASDDPRHLRVALPPLDGAPACREVWSVDAEVACGRDGGVRWASGGGWLFAALEWDAAGHADIGDGAESTYRALGSFLAARPEYGHVQRLWNYLDRINLGDGDSERYKYFCAGRARGMAGFFPDGFPAATAVGLPSTPGGMLQVYCLATRTPGARIENPRQLSAWRYPRQYGRTPPSFARAMRLPAGDALAISGTAAIIGHQSQHNDDLAAQLAEIRANLDALLQAGGMPAGFDARAPLKVYVRHPADAPAVVAFLDAHMPGAPRLLLQGDICRRELLVEIDGWRFA